MSEPDVPTITVLAELLNKTKYKDWKIYIAEASCLPAPRMELRILIECEDTYNPGEMKAILHSFIIPKASYNERSWRRWLFDQIVKVNLHEAMEYFVVDGSRPYAPNHGPGHDPYIINELGTLQEKRTNYLGEERDQDAPLHGRF